MNYKFDWFGKHPSEVFMKEICLHVKIIVVPSNFDAWAKLYKFGVFYEKFGDFCIVNIHMVGIVVNPADFGLFEILVLFGEATTWNAHLWNMINIYG